MKLTNPTDDQLNAAFAEKVAGWKYDERNDAWKLPDGFLLFGKKPPFTTSADAVLPWLEKWGMVESDRMHRYCAGWRWEVKVWQNGGSYFPKGEAESDTFPRAATIALLRAHGVTVEFTEGQG